MRAETLRILQLTRELAVADLPQLLGELETIRATAMARLYAVPAPPEDRLLTPAQAAEKLSISEKFVYKHAKELGGVPVGGALRFSEKGLNQAIRRRRAL